MKTENEFSKWLVGNLRKEGWHVTRIENAVANGTPDIVAFDGNKDFWIELKVCKTKCNKVKLRPGQWKWHTDRMKAGGESYVIIYNSRNDTVSVYENKSILKCVPPYVGASGGWITSRDIFVDEFQKAYRKDFLMNAIYERESECSSLDYPSDKEIYGRDE